MKNVVFSILSLISFNISAQDVDMLNLINTYRKNNSKSILVYSNELSNVSEKQVNVILEQNKVTHSETKDEIITFGVSMPIIKQNMDSFILFLKNNLNIIYNEPKTECEVVKLFKQYIIYKFHSSKMHNSILLGQYTHVGFHVELSNIVYVDNNAIINGNKITFNNFISHYKGNYCAVLNFKK